MTEQNIDIERELKDESPIGQSPHLENDGRPSLMSRYSYSSIEEVSKEGYQWFKHQSVFLKFSLIVLLFSLMFSLTFGSLLGLISLALGFPSVGYRYVLLPILNALLNRLRLNSSGLK